MVTSATAVVDHKPYIEYDSTIGYRYIPSTRQVLPRPGGGTYEITINSAGVRSDREYYKNKPRGVFRILVCGDSYAAGQFVSNDQRFSELLERRVPKLEVINLALEGTGTDQQLLIYEQAGRQYEHDLVLLLPFLQNIRRNTAEAREGYDPVTHEKILRAKPRFILRDGHLELQNVPVPSRHIAGNEKRDGYGPATDEELPATRRVKTMLSRTPGIDSIKKIAYSVMPWEPFPEYRSADVPEWQLMAAIIRRFKETAKTVPLVVAPVFYDSYVRYRMARNYWDRFNSLAENPGIHVIDLLPHFKQLGREAVRAFLTPHDCHFSSYGHVVLAEALQSELTNRSLLKVGVAE